MEQMRSVTLTGALPGDADADAAWSRVAALLKRDVADFRQHVATRLPVTFKPVAEAQAQGQCEALRACGVEALVLDDDGERLWLQLDGAPRGPMAVAYARFALQHGTVRGDLLACRQGERQWQPLHAVLGDPPAPDLGFEETVAPPAAAGGATSASSAVMPVRVATPHAGRPLPSTQYAPGLHAGFWSRVVAYLVDYLILLAGLFVVGLVVGFVGVLGGSHPENISRATWWLVSVLAMWLYYALFESSARQATPGKMALGLRVTDGNGGRIGFGRASGRHFGKIISALIVCIGYMMAGWTARKQALHDLMAGTCVVRKQPLEAFLAGDTDTVDGAQPGMPGWAIALLVVFGCGFVILPILAAIAIPAYQEYVIRAQASEGLALADGARTAVNAYVREHGVTPGDNAAAGLPPAKTIQGRYVSAVAVNNGFILVTYGKATANAKIRGHHLVLAPRMDSHILVWRCASPDIEQKYLPSRCR